MDTSTYSWLTTRLVDNPGSSKGIFGRLKKTNSDSRLIPKEDQTSDEEMRETLKTVFEGRGLESNRVITRQEEASPGETPSKTALNANYYDRLSQGNLKGYSPQLQALQSALNIHRPPGAPKIIETGKLDYETLGYPRYAMSYDIQNLERRLRYERNFALAKFLGLERNISSPQLLDPSIESELKTKAASRVGLNPLLVKRQAALERAAAAERDFEATALLAKEPLKINRPLLESLSAKQKETARWITAASLEEEVYGLNSQEDFLKPELLSLIEKTPVDKISRTAYKSRGLELKNKLSRLKSNDESAIGMLESLEWHRSLERLKPLLAESSALRGNLSRNIQNFVKVPYLLSPLIEPKSWWRALIDDIMERLFPGSAYARSLKHRKEKKGVLMEVFMKIAGGDFEAAHTVLAAYLG